MGAVKNEALYFCLSIFISWSFTSALLTPDGVNFEGQYFIYPLGTPFFGFSLLMVTYVSSSSFDGYKKLLNDPSGVLNWDENAVDPCGWTLVTCSHDNLVTTLAMGRQNLSGTISESIGNLTHLISFQLQENNISGTIPVELGNLPKLEELDLSNNSLTGDIPSSLAQLENLQYLRLNDNYLIGAVPMAFANLTHLNFIDLSFNNLSGPIPTIQAKRVNVLGNPMICSTSEEAGCSEATPLPLPISQNSTQNFKTSSRQSSHGVTLALALGSATGCFSLLIIGLVVLWKYNQKKRIFWDINEQQHEEVCLGNLRRFPFRELRIATNNFSSKNFLGKGGFGNVYKGHLQDGTVVAVKRLRDGNISGGEDQFQTEVEMISLAVHRNLLRLYGFCITSTERLLVYPYMSNGSVAARLKAKPSLDWGTRKRIALGAARGLVYLHEQCDPKIIHRDVKAANILLDDYCEAVVGDFGLAKLLDRHDSHVTTAVRGTIGHIAPEYLSTGQSSEKTDVFGFGILLIELITGMRALEFGKASGNQKGGMLDWVRKIHEEKKIELLVDKDLKNSYDVLEVEETLKVALLCTQYMPSHRPKMSEVVRLLEGDGVAERWEDSQRNGGSRATNSEASFTGESGVGYGDADESWLAGQDMELSGPR